MSAFRILVIDDNQAIHRDFRKILAPAIDDALAAAETALFDTAQDQPPQYEIDYALQGAQGLELARGALREKRPYAMAFVDMHMPPGLDGLETIAKLWEWDAHIQTVLCTAHCESWRETCRRLGRSDRLIILKKPFDAIEVEQLADSLTRKWQRNMEANERVAALEHLVNEYSQQPVAARSRQRQAQERRLAEAIERGEFAVHYQPLLDIQNLRIAGLEALLRWHDPERGKISPAEFIPLAEETGLILPLGEFALRTVCEQLANWRRHGVPTVPVAVNISPIQLQRQALDVLVRSILHETGVPPRLLALELTETALVNELAHVSELRLLREAGVNIEIDDFGTGYSCLNYLRQLPADMLKIDRSFIRQIEHHGREETILSSIISMAHNLGLRVIAEGVETTAQLRTLQAHGCDIVQGYLFGRPMSAAACTDLLNRAQRQAFGHKLRALLLGGGRSAAPEQQNLAFCV